MKGTSQSEMRIAGRGGQVNYALRPRGVEMAACCLYSGIDASDDRASHKRSARASSATVQAANVAAFSYPGALEACAARTRQPMELPKSQDIAPAIGASRAVVTSER